MIVASLLAGVGFLPRAWARPWFIALVGVAVLAELAGAAVADPAAWLPPVMIVAAFLYLPLLEGPLYTLAMAEAPAQPDRVGDAARYARLVAVGVLTAVFLSVPGLLLFVVGLGVAYGMAYAYPGFNPMDATTWTASGPVLMGGGVVLGIGGLGILWLSARVALGPAATVAERRVLMLSSWPLTRGFGWRLAAARLMVGVGALALFWVADLALGAMAPGWAARAAPVAGGLILLAVHAPFKVGVLSYFYAHRSPIPSTP